MADLTPNLPLLLPTRGRGKRLMLLLRRELGIPDGVRSFEVRFALNEPVTVKLDYVARERAPCASS